VEFRATGKRIRRLEKGSGEDLELGGSQRLNANSRQKIIQPSRSRTKWGEKNNRRGRRGH